MTHSNTDDTHTTRGRQFRTPAHPDVLMALGRALYNFLNLEESVTAILYEAGAAPLPVTRGKMAGAKEAALQALAHEYRSSPNGQDVANALDRAVTEFGRARGTIRNELLHAHPFTVGEDADGSYLPGLAYTAKDGESWKTISRSPEDLLDLAVEIERALDPLNTARMLVRGTPLTTL